MTIETMGLGTAGLAAWLAGVVVLGWMFEAIYRRMHS